MLGLISIIVALIISAFMTLRFGWTVLDNLGYRMGAKYWSYQTFYGACLGGWWYFWLGVVW